MPPASSVQRVRTGIRQGILLVTLGAVFGITANTLRPHGLPLKQAWEFTETDPRQAVSEISIHVAWQAYQEGLAIFLDARDPLAFEDVHIEGALNVSPETVDTRTEELGLLADAGMQLICYCGGPGCRLGHELAAALQEKGFSSLRVMASGLSGWQDEGFPVEGEGV